LWGLRDAQDCHANFYDDMGMQRQRNTAAKTAVLAAICHEDKDAFEEEPSNNLLGITSLAPKLSLSRRRVDSRVQFRIFRDIAV
jgi:hypothetical protein